MAEYTGLYTKHKTQKRKVWHDCVLKVNGSSVKLIPLDEEGRLGQVLDSIRLKPSQTVEEGMELELDLFLVMFEELRNPAPVANQPVQTLPIIANQSFASEKPSLLAQCLQNRPLQHQSLHQPARRQPQAKSWQPPARVVAAEPAPLQSAVKRQRIMTTHAVPPARKASEIISLLGGSSRGLISSTVDAVSTTANQPSDPPIDMMRQTTAPVASSSSSMTLSSIIASQRSHGTHASFSAPSSAAASLPAPAPSRGVAVAHRTGLGKGTPSLHRDKHSSSNGAGAPLVKRSRMPSSSGPRFCPTDGGATLTGRSIVIPDQFSSVRQYKQTFDAAVVEELNVRLDGLAQDYARIVREAVVVSSSAGAPVACPSSSHGPASLRTVRKPGPNQGRMFWSCSKCNFFAWFAAPAGGAEAASSSTMPLPSSLTSFQVAFLWNRSVYVYPDIDFFYHQRQKEVFLKLASGQRPVGDGEPLRDPSFALDDVWILDSSPAFNNHPVVALARWHGPSSASRTLAVQPLTAFKVPRGKGARLCALHCPANANTEWRLLTNLRTQLTPEAVAQSPVLQQIVEAAGSLPGSAKRQVVYRSTSAATTDVGPEDPAATNSATNSDDDLAINLERAEVDRLAEEFCSNNSLNEDQRAVLLACSQFFTCPDDDDHVSSIDCNDHQSNNRDPIVLVHGYFGSGKSFLLCCIIEFLLTVAIAGDAQRFRVLVSAVTNVAVDRVLKGLLYRQVDLLRVGSLRKISKHVLSSSIHQSKLSSSSSSSASGKNKRNQDSDTVDAIHELQALLADPATSKRDRHLYLQELQALRAGSGKQRVEALVNTRVVGVTTAAASFTVLDNQQFSLVVLDECSQMVEPQSLMPLARFGVKRLLMVGDPRQLPPTLCARGPGLDPATGLDRGLGQPLFVRLAKAQSGRRPFLLRTQYRCAPIQADLCSQLFYNNTIVNGSTVVNAAANTDQGSVPALLFLNADDGTEQRNTSMGSMFNQFESRVAAQCVKLLLDARFMPSQIGVIAMYRAQCAAVRELLLEDPDIVIPEPLADDDADNDDQSQHPDDEQCHDTTDDVDQRQEIVGTGVATDDGDCSDVDDGSDRFLDDCCTEQKETSAKTEPSESIADLQISTVDAFQGAERECIVLTVGRTSGMTEFLESPQRLNVALSRARRSLIIIGSVNGLVSDENWSGIVQYCRSRNCLRNADEVLMTKQFPSI